MSHAKSIALEGKPTPIPIQPAFFRAPVWRQRLLSRPQTGLDHVNQCFDHRNRGHDQLGLAIAVQV